MTKSQQFPIYKKVTQWVQAYGRPDVPDDRGVQDFMLCETREEVRSLQIELIAITEGRFDEKILDDLVGLRRKGRYGSYVQWAKLMLQWINSHKV